MTDPSVSAESPRPQFVENARKFFINPKVRSTPLEEQKKFLITKGVTEAEIEEALKKIAPDQLAANQAPLPEPIIVAPPPQNGIVSAAQSVVVIGGASFLIYKFLRSWVLPRFFDIADPAEKERSELKSQLNELQNTTKFVMDTVSQTLETVAAQQEQLNRALTLISAQKADVEMQRMQTDLSVIKSLLLRSDQFPQVPPLVSSNSNSDLNGKTKLKDLSTEIPAWQRAQTPQENGQTEQISDQSSD